MTSAHPVVEYKPAHERHNSMHYNYWDCFNDIELCMCSCFCHPCLAASTSSELDYNGEPNLCFYPHSNYKNRMQLQSQYHIHDDECTDTVIHSCCPVCDAIQVARELRYQRALHQSAAPQQQKMVSPSISQSQLPSTPLMHTPTRVVNLQSIQQMQILPQFTPQGRRIEYIPVPQQIQTVHVVQSQPQYLSQNQQPLVQRQYQSLQLNQSQSSVYNDAEKPPPAYDNTNQ